MVCRRRRKAFSKPKRKTKRLPIDDYARLLRLRMTRAETLLWGKLQSVMSQWNVSFECQGVVAGRFVADFVCRSHKLIVEVDGSIHRLSSVRVKDKYRTMVLTKLGYTVVRFSNQQVYRSITKVVNTIQLKLNEG